MIESPLREWRDVVYLKEGHSALAFERRGFMTQVAVPIGPGPNVSDDLRRPLIHRGLDLMRLGRLQRAGVELELSLARV